TRHTVARDVSAYQHRLGAERLQLSGGLLGGGIRAEEADRHARGALAGEAERDRPADPARAARPEDRRAGERSGPQARGLSGSYTGAELGISSQPIRVRGSRGESSAFEEAYPRSSRSRIFSSP